MKRIQEFWYCVAAQEQLPLHKGHSLSSDKYDNLINFISFFKDELKSGKTSKKIIKKCLLNSPELLNDLRILIGVSDKRLYLDLTYLFNTEKQEDGSRFLSEERENLVKHDTTFFINQLKNSSHKKEFAKKISNYFLNKGIENVLITLSKLSKNEIKNIFEYLVSPKEIQQKQAKYRGHGAEMAFSKIFNELGLNFTPSNKHINPMATHDPNVDLSTMSLVKKNTKNSNIHSFDLVVYDNDDNIRILVQSLIHSSDPGQYGVNKSDETVAIKKLIDKYNEQNTDKPVFLLGSVDGVGFCENPNGTIIKMLDVFDDFFQTHTLFKIGIFAQKIGLINNLKGVSFDTNFFETYVIEYFKEKYLLPLGLENLSNTNFNPSMSINAGKGTLIFK